MSSALALGKSLVIARAALPNSTTRWSLSTGVPLGVGTSLTPPFASSKTSIVVSSERDSTLIVRFAGL